MCLIILSIWFNEKDNDKITSALRVRHLVSYSLELLLHSSSQRRGLDADAVLRCAEIMLYKAARVKE
jgi:hypothetical protein